MARVQVATTSARVCGTLIAGKLSALLTMAQANVDRSNPELNGGGGWGIFNALLGWQNSATYGSVISYNVYWIFVMAGFIVMWWSERRGGARRGVAEEAPAINRKESGSDNTSSDGVVVEKNAFDAKGTTMPEVTLA
jgi:hypothetical protein